MREGQRRRDWTVAEERYLLESAGRVPKRDICRKLRRSGEAVRQKAKRLRDEGHAVDLRCHRPRVTVCPSCGCMRRRFGKEGICEPCRRRAQLARIQSRIAALLAELPPEERAVYEGTEAETESEPLPMPKAPDVRGMSAYRAARAREAHDMAMEDWAAATLNRQVRAAQKRKERIEKKAKSMTPLEKHQVRGEK